MKVVIVLLFLFSVTFCQEKYFVYFTDKGVDKNTNLSGTEYYKEAVNSLSVRAIERRKKTLGNNFINYQDVPLKSEYLEVIEKLGIKIINKLKWLNAVSVSLDDKSFEKLRNIEFVQKIEKVKKLKFKEEAGFILPNKQNSNKNLNNFNLEYGNSYIQLALSDIPLVHQYGFSGEGVLIGILDTGFDWQLHESLKSRLVINEYDFVQGDTITSNQLGDVGSQHNHGTYCFSILGGYLPGELIGAAYGAEFILAKTEDVRSEKHIEEDNYQAAMEWMESLGVDITTSSLGYSEFDPGEGDYSYEDMNGNTTIVTKAAESAFEKGVLVITSAGNEGNSNWHYITAPADGFNTLAIGAVDDSNIKASFSSFGPTFDGRVKPDIVTQGVFVYGAAASTSIGFNFSSGTSSAAPIAAGIAGLVYQAYPHLTNIQLRKILIEAGDQSGSPDFEKGYGLISAEKAVSFPNIEKSDNLLTFHKIIFDEAGVENSIVNLVYKRNSDNFNQIEMVSESFFKYYAELPESNFFLNDSVKFYFTYTDGNQNLKRIPSTDFYHFINRNGSVIVSYLTNIKNDEVIPSGYSLSQNYPNPFNPNTVIEFVAFENDKAIIDVFDITGRKIKTIYDDIAGNGINIASWNGTNLRNQKVASGIYFYHLRIFKDKKRVYSAVNKMVLIK